MERTTGRRPVANFFVKKELQIRITLRIIAAVIVATVVSSATIVLTYYLRHRSVLFYQLEESGNLSKESIYHIILPGLIISTAIGVIVAVVIGLYASRKFAVPVYKLERWAKLLREGRMNVHLRFREQRQMDQLCSHCNALADELRMKFEEFRKLVEGFKSGEGVDREVADRAAQILDSMDLSEAPHSGTKA